MEWGAFLNINEASRMLGFSEAILRQWTDIGKIKAFITSGSHRHYSTASLKKFISSHPVSIGKKALIFELKETAELAHSIGPGDSLRCREGVPYIPQGEGYL